MRHISLFSGFGGFDLPAQWMGWENVAHCEINPFCRRVLQYYWPNAISYEDIRATDFTVHRGKIDILTGGFPCQPYSTAGKRKGTDDARHLWPQMRRAIREVSPPWIVGENVRGLIDWNGGMVFDQVQADLEADGYEVIPFLLPAAGVNAPHKRYRIWFVAYADSNRYRGEDSRGRHRCEADKNEGTAQRSDRERFRRDVGRVGPATIITDANGNFRRQRRQHAVESETTERETIQRNSRFRGNWENFPSEPPLCSGNDGISSRLDRTAVFEGVKESKRKSTFYRWREQSLMGYGNAVVPQVVLEIFKTIQDHEHLS